MNGSKSNLTKNLFMKVCATFSGIFNIDYLLNGEGSLLTTEEQVKSEDIEKAVNQPTDEMTANILELYAQRVRLVDDLRATLKDELEEIRTIKSELQQARDDFRDATYRLTKAIERINNNNSSNTRFDIAAEQN
jgi:septal ring factor EnvC (AmiA/AmiB activator)